MYFPKPETDLRHFRLSRINEPQYRHMWWLLFWPAYLLRYFLVENLNPASTYHVMHCFLDDLIPFREGFLIFYASWYFLIVGVHLYTLLYDADTFRRYTKFLCISVVISTATFLLYPSCQELRPAVFPRDNFLSRLVGLIYAVDTNTNVFPSEHVLGAFAAVAAAAHTRGLRKPGILAALTVLAVLICASTMFLKQHSVCDVLGALCLCPIVYFICYEKRGKS